MPAMAVEPGALQSPDGDAWVKIAKPHLYADVFLDTDSYSGVYTLTTRAADVGSVARLLLVASVDGSWYSHDGARWVPWTSGRVADVKAWSSKTLSSTEQIPFLTNEELFAGEYTIYAGYQVGNNPAVYNGKPLQFTVQPGTSDSLLRFRSEEAMEAYLKDGLQNAGSVAFAARNAPVFLAAAAGAEADKSAGRTSSTNVQEVGVDEADTIKVDGNNLYSLASCKEQPCLEVHTLNSATATSTPLSSFAMDTKQAPTGMFMVDNGILGQKMLVTVAGQNNWGWFSIWGWGQGKTELQFLNVSNPAAVTAIEKLTFDGSLVSSRRVGNTLYVVTRYAPTLEGYYPYPMAKAEEDANAKILAATTLPEILPRVEDSRKKMEDLVKSRDCYLPTSAVDGNLNPSIITITSIPLNSPTSHSSKCFLGGSETLYMTPDSLYLATTSWDYSVRPALDKIGLIYSPNHMTAIHKFALNGSSIEYRGSAEVKGHLGWNEDKKSFRMGENKGYLNIATSIGETWDNTSTTRLTVLKETAARDKLQTVKTIDGIGLKGEELYAARFLGNRGYLVTFRITDPLYVLDLSNQEQPKIAGELKIEGYSDYLHPISENLLLGIGKDAIADARSPDEGGRGAWYQGVKLSLFNVSNIAKPTEVSTRILGKRGTQSDVLWDHHALSFLPATGTEPARLAIPVQLHDKVPTWTGWKVEPSAWYDYTHTALYSFEVSAQGINQVGRIISEVASDTPNKTDPRVFTTATDISASSDAGVSRVGILPGDSIFAPVSIPYSDRSVLKDDAVYYVHEGKVLSSKWGQSK